MTSAQSSKPTNHHGNLESKTMATIAPMSCQDARNEAVAAMLVRWPWYGHFSMGLGVIETNAVPIAACGWDPKTGQGNLYFHPQNFPKFDLKTRVWAIVHEITHWINLHCHTNYRGKLVNIAMDMAVNSLLATQQPVPVLPTHPEEFITIDGVWHSYAALEPGLKRPPDAASWEWYFNWLLDRKKNIQNKLEELLKKLGLELGDGGDGDNLSEGVAPGLGDKVTDHSAWDDMTEAEKEIVKQFVNNRAEQASQNARPPGNIAGSLEGLVAACKPKIDWKRYIKNIMGSAGDVDVDFTRSRMNKYGEPGRVTLMPKGEVVVAQDTSGSITDKELGLFWGAVEEIVQRLHVQTYVMQVDAKVQSFEKFKNRPQTSYEVKGRGGTHMPEIFDYLNEHPEVSAKVVVVCTDGYTDYPTSSQVKGRKVLWVITNQNMVDNFPHDTGIGKAIWLNPDQ